MIPQADYMEREGQKVVLALAGTDNFKRVRVDDFVISLRSFQGGIEHSAFDGAITPAYTVLRPSEQVQVGYFRYVLKSAGFISALNATTEGIRDGKAVPYESFGDLELPVPPPNEQRRIAAFLDYETARIDEMGKELERLEQMLDEHRAAVILEAVTGRLDGPVRRGQTGNAWIPELPAHWTVSPLKRDLATVTSGSRGWAQYYSDGGALFVRIGNLTRRTLDLDLSDVQRVDVPPDTEGERTRVRAGDLLISITAYLGSVAVAPPGLETAYVSQHIAIARLREGRLLPRWVGYVVLSDIGRAYLDAQAYGGTKIQLSLEDIKNIPVPIPPISEQQATVARLESVLREVDGLVAQARAVRSLLLERRSALITAAVTGQIDVSSWTPPDDWLTPEAA